MDSSTQSLQSETSGYLVSEPSESASSPEQVAHPELPEPAPEQALPPPAATVSVESPAPEPEKPAKTKMQLWNELKLLSESPHQQTPLALISDCRTSTPLLAFTRSLTTIYTVVVLSLHTRVQLNILGRYSYIRSVRELEQSFQPAAGSGESTVSAWWSYLAGAVGVGPSSLPAKELPEARGGLEDDIDQETEMAYLTFSWWLMHVGWRELKERVALAVNEVFGPCVPPLSSRGAESGS
jgi:peroxin-3